MEIAIIILISISIIIGLLNFFRKSGFSNAKIDIADLEKKLEQENKYTRENLSSNLSVGNNALISGLKATNDTVIDSVKNLSTANETKINEMKEELAKGLTEIRYNVSQSLKEVREDNTKQLAEMRNVVDEKLSSTLNERLSQSFNIISERLENVSKGLGEMQKLAGDVKGLEKVLTNVKTRGTWGEVSLDNILEGILTKEQYVRGCNVTGRKGEQVDFAVILPGKGEDKVYLPIDVKFPTEDYQRLIEASEGTDLIKYSDSIKALENAVKEQAKSISRKYINPPQTTDFAIMYLPTEGLYAEIIRNAGLAEELQNKYKITPAGPSTITALLNSLSMGFNTLRVQKSSNEIFNIFKDFRKDFGKFVSNLELAKEQMNRATDTLEEATKRTTLIKKKLDRVEGLSISEEDGE